MDQDASMKNDWNVIHDENYAVKYSQHKLNAGTIVFTKNRPSETLNGVWHFTPDLYDMGLRSGWHQEFFNRDGNKLPWDYDVDGGESILTPSCWNLLKPEYTFYEGSAWYARDFKYQPCNPDERVFLRIGAANYDAKIFLNQEYLGDHQGGSTPFYLELTGKLKEENIIQICVNNNRKTDRVPMRNIDWFNYGGIYRDVELFHLPSHFIKDFFCYLIPDGQMRTVWAEIEMDDPAVTGEVIFEIPEAGISRKAKLQQGKAVITVESEWDLWSPENPKLYEVRASFQGDQVHDRVGFRQISVAKQSILLNGKEIYLRGICVHEDSLDLGRVNTEEKIKHLFADAKDLGCNFLRLAHYPHHELVAATADALGFLLWEEIPVYWAIDFVNPDTYQDAENQLAELILRDRNRCSVIIWSVGNENEDTDDRFRFMSQLSHTAKLMDPSRLVSAACLISQGELKIVDRLANELDIIGINEYYGWYRPDFGELQNIINNSHPDKPVIITETGADALAGFHSPAGELFSEEYMAEVYRRQIEVIAQIDYVKGMTPWVLYDFRSPRRCNRYQQGFNRKGLIAEDKETRKLAFHILQHFYQEKARE